MVLALFLLALNAAANAEAIAFQLIQHDGAGDTVRTSSYVIEDTLFDYYFSLGYIVTNSPAVAEPDSEKDSYFERIALEEAREGGCSYFVLIITDYDLEATASPESLSVDNLKEAQWKLIDVKADTVIKTGVTKPSGKTTKSVQAGVSDFTCSVADEILDALHKRK